jgi:hypothetical protein
MESAPRGYPETVRNVEQLIADAPSEVEAFGRLTSERAKDPGSFQYVLEHAYEGSPAPRSAGAYLIGQVMRVIVDGGTAADVHWDPQQVEVWKWELALRASPLEEGFKALAEQVPQLEAIQTRVVADVAQARADTLGRRRVPWRPPPGRIPLKRRQALTREIFRLPAAHIGPDSGADDPQLRSPVALHVVVRHLLSVSGLNDDFARRRS